MSATDKPLVRAQGVPAPQYYNEVLDQYEPITGKYGANSFIERGRIVKDVYNGSANATRNYSENMFGMAVVNDGQAQLTVAVNAFTIIVNPGEAFDDLFDAFTSVTVTATDDYRLVVRQ